MSYSVGTYSGGTAFVGFGSFLPTFNSPFPVALGGTTTIQKVSIASTVVGTGFGLYATYAGFFDGTVPVYKNRRIAHVQFYNATEEDVREDVGVHWMDFPAGYFPLNIPAHIDNGEGSFLLSAFDHGECAAEQVSASVKWMDYSAGYFPLNIPVFVDNGLVSIVQSVLHPDPTLCAPEEAPVPIKWLQYASEFDPNDMDLFVDDVIPFGYAPDLVCPFDSEKIERAFVTLRNPPTPTQYHPTPVQSKIDTRSGSALLLIIAVMTVLFMIPGAMFYTLRTRYSILISDLLDDEPLEQQLAKQPDEQAKKKALEAALYKLGATPASRGGGGRYRNKKPKKTKKTTNNIYDVEKHSFSVAPVLESINQDLWYLSKKPFGRSSSTPPELKLAAFVLPQP